MITPEMIERAREKHYFQFYESGKNGTTFELGNPIYGTDCAIDTPISKDTWTPSKLADYIESQRKVPSKALDVKYCENMLRNICGEWKNFSEAYGTYDKETSENTHSILVTSSKTMFPAISQKRFPIFAKITTSSFFTFPRMMKKPHRCSIP